MTTISGSTLADLRVKYHDTLLSCTGENNAVVLFSHFGEFNQVKIDSILKILESSALENGAKRRIMKRLSSVVIEMLQNISIHGSKDGNGKSHSYLVVSFNGKDFKLRSGNLIHTDAANLLDYKLTELNKLTNEDLRKLFIETLCNENFSYKGGAGLGLLTIAKKSKGDLHYEINQVNEHYSYYSNELLVETE